MVRSMRFAALPLAIWLFSLSSVFASITYVDDYTSVQVGTQSHFGDDFALDSGGTTLSTSATGVTATATSAFAPAALSLTFSGANPGGIPFSYSRGYAYADFVANTDMDYQILGSITNDADTSRLYISLIDVTDLDNIVTLFRTDLQNYDDPNPVTLTAGSTDGNRPAVLEGSLSGVLLAGHAYSWSSLGQGFSNLTSFGPDYSGFSELRLSEQSTVPEPATLAIWGGIGMLSLFGSIRGRCRFSAAKRPS